VSSSLINYICSIPSLQGEIHHSAATPALGELHHHSAATPALGELHHHSAATPALGELHHHSAATPALFLSNKVSSTITQQYTCSIPSLQGDLHHSDVLTTSATGVLLRTCVNKKFRIINLS
jgi:hypothetical protein